MGLRWCRSWSWKHGGERRSLWGEFDNAELQVPVKHPGGNVPEVTGNASLNLRRERSGLDRCGSHKHGESEAGEYSRQPH